MRPETSNAIRNTTILSKIYGGHDRVGRSAAPGWLIILSIIGSLVMALSRVKG